MAKIGVRLKIDVTNIEKARLYQGKKGKYLDATCFIELGEADQYGQHGMITQDVTKEEREAGTKGPILGNVTVFYRDGLEDAPPKDPRQQPSGQGGGGGGDDFSDDIPFAAMHNICGG